MEGEFPKDRSTKDGLYLYCKLCAAKKSAKWHSENPEQSKLTQVNNQRKRQSTGKVAESEKRMVDSNPNYKIAQRVRSRISNLMRGTLKAACSSDLLGCSIEELKVHLASHFVGGMSFDNYGEWHIDHIKACATFDLTDLEQQKICFHYSNLQPLWALDNLKKNKY